MTIGPGCPDYIQSITFERYQTVGPEMPANDPDAWEARKVRLLIRNDTDLYFDEEKGLPARDAAGLREGDVIEPLFEIQYS